MLTDNMLMKQNLPVPKTSFVGREKELKNLSDILRNSQRLVTLLAPGGMGKTRLAIALAKQEIGRYQDGVFFIALASIAKVDGIVPALAKALHQPLRFGIDPIEQTLEYMRSKALLLILDNYEHLLPDVDIVAMILEAAPHVQMVVTSRRRLNLIAETVYQIDELDLPDETSTRQLCDYGAVQLFLQHAQCLKPIWQPTKDDLVKVAEICNLVVGMPLAIILAATWFNTLSLDEIIQETKRDLDFLATTSRDIPERLRSIRAVFERSWKNMSLAEQQAFRRLSVFRGGGDLAAFQHVAGVGVQVLQRLVNRALIVHTNEGRYGIHELLRQYGEKRLREDEREYHDIRTRHTRYYALFTLQQYEALHVSETERWLNLMDVELDNLQFGWDWAIQTVDHEALWQFSKLYLYYKLRCRYREGEAMFARAVEALASEEQDEYSALLQARMLAFHTYLCHLCLQTDLMLRSYQQSIAILRQLHDVGKNRETVAILYFLGSSLHIADPDEAQTLLEECIGYCEQYNHWDALLVAARMHRMDFVSSLADEIDEIHTGLKQAHQLDYLQGKASFTRYCAMIAFWIEQDSTAAIDLMAQSITLYHQCDDPINLAGALVTQADICLADKRFIDAHQALVEAMTLFKQVGSLAWMLSPTLVCVSRVLLAFNDLSGAAELCACMRQAPFLNHPPTRPLNLIWEPDTYSLWQQLERELNEDALTTAIQQGSSLTLTGAIERSLALLHHVDPRTNAQTIDERRKLINLQLDNPLTSRECDILMLICAGYSNREIADNLTISKNTLKTHIRHIYDKLAVTNRAQAILRVQALGLLDR